jgi:hypothetical protein
MPILRKILPAQAIFMATILSLPLCAGCGEDGPQRTAIWGKVTWKEQPVPRGVIYFNPNVNKGNTGPQGYALIRDGAFDTRQSPGKGCVAGPHSVQIQGFDGQNIRDGHPYGNQLFASYETSIDVSAEAKEINLTIPDSVAPVAAPSSQVE